MRIPVTVLVQTKNEAVGIESCLSALRDFDQVIVVDSNSTDQTAQLAAATGAEVVNFTWDGHYPKKKQWQLDNVETRNKWILFLDADETPTQTFLDTLPDSLAKAEVENISAFDLQLVYVFDGSPLLHGHRVVKRALLNRGQANFPPMDDLDAPGMGELEGHYQPKVSGHTRLVPNALLHDDKDPVHTWFARHNKYSEWEAHLRANPDAKRSITRARSRQGQVFDRVPGKPLAFFIYTFVARRGFLDGTAGFNYAIALAFYYWQINLKLREVRRNGSNRGFG